MFEELRERASSWWNSEETVARRRQVGDTADSARQAMEGVGDAQSGFVRRGADAAIEGARFFEDGVDEGSHALAGTVADVPVLGDVAEGYADVVTYGAQVQGGVVGGAADLTAAMSHAGTHPLDTARGLAGMAAHIPAVPLPGPLNSQASLQGGLAAYDAVIDGEGSLSERLDAAGEGMDAVYNQDAGERLAADGEYWSDVGGALLQPYEESVNQGRDGEVAGRAMFDAAMILLPGVGEAGAVGGATELAEGARAAELAEGARAAELAEGARAAELAEGARAAELAEGARAAELAEGSRAATAPRPPGTREPILPPEPVDPVPHAPRSPTPEPPPPIEPANSPRSTIPDDAGIRPTEPAPAEPARPTDVDMSEVTNRATEPAPEPWQRRTQPEEIRPTRPDDLVEQARRDARMSIDERSRPTAPDDAGIRPTEPAPAEPAPPRSSEPAPPRSSSSAPPEPVDPDGTRIARARDMDDLLRQEPPPPERVDFDDVMPEGEPNPELQRNPADEIRARELDREIDNVAWRQEHPIRAGIVDADNATGGRVAEYSSRAGRYFDRGRRAPGLNPQTAGFVIESGLSEWQRLQRWLNRRGGS